MRRLLLYTGYGGGGARNTYPTTQCSFLLSPDYSRQIIQDGGSMIERDGKNDFSVKGENKMEGLFTV